MNIQEKIAADEAAISAAQNQLDAAKALLDSDKIALEAIQPHLTVLAEIESYAVHIEESVRDGFASVIARAKALF